MIEYLGIDLGGTKILLKAFGKGGKVHLSAAEKTQAGKGQAELLEQLCALISQSFHPKIKGIGIGLAGAVSKEGKILRTPHLPFKKNFPLNHYLEKKYKVPVHVQNDVRAFLVAEKERGQLRACQNAIALMVGTGVGSAILANGMVLEGQGGSAGEAGHMAIDLSSKLSTLEQRIGGNFVPQLARSLGIRQKITSYDLGKNTAAARKIKKSMIQSFGIGLSNLNLLFNPEAFVLGGSIYRLFLSPHKNELKNIIQKHSPNGKSPKLTDSRGDHFVALGAAISCGMK